MRCLLLVAMVNYSSCSRLLTALNASAEAVSLAWTPLVGSALHKGDLHKLRDCWSVPIKILHGAKPNVTTEEVTLCLRGKGCNRNVASKGYPECDYISMRVNTKGAWDECDLLVKFIHAEAKYHEHAPAPDAPGPLVLDVGANQGMCTHSILLNTKARVVAFEPNPSNQFFLTQSLLLTCAHGHGKARTQQPRAGCGCGCARARAANGALTGQQQQRLRGVRSLTSVVSFDPFEARRS